MTTLKLVRRPEDEAHRAVRAALGDAEARAALARTWSPVLYRFALRMLGDEQDAYDAAQDTLVKVLNALPSYDPGRPFSTWVFGIARNTCIDQHRRRWRRDAEPPADVPDPRPSPAQLAELDDRSRAVLAALQDLPPMYREALVLYHHEGLKYVEIADVLQLPLGTVMNRIFRARQKLREALLARGFEP